MKPELKGLKVQTTVQETRAMDATVEEDVALEKLGYQQELKRNFGLLGMIGFSFSIVTCWSALSGVFIIGVQSGGPPVMIWSWVGVCIVSLSVAYSLAEMCSAYPTAGGQYSWVAILAPPRLARGMSYICGWFMLIGILAMGAVNNFIMSNFILGMANLSFPSYTIERWHTVLVAYLLAVINVFVNLSGPGLLNRISRVNLFVNIAAFLIIVTVILVCNDHKQSPSFVFTDFQNYTGFNPAYTAIIGILQSCFGMCCYDAPSKMTEEMLQPRKHAPQAIVLSVWMGSITGFIFLIAVCFCIGDIETTATSSTGVPILQIFYDSTRSVPGACVLASLIVFTFLVCAMMLLAEGSRAVFAFARDQGLPFSGTLSKVHGKTKVPVYALVTAAVAQMALNSIYFGTITGFNTVISIATEGFYVSYALPLVSLLLSRCTSSRPPLDGPYSLGRWGLPLNLIGFVFLLFSTITFNFPSLAPVTSENMNYTSAAIGLIMLIAAVTWITTGRKNFTGPMVRERSDSEKTLTRGD
ncbi:MAG: hypothetical protein M1820_002462 [Bogoriella megaspora]|nr:MAG: hypothetical protein M1820_002462 [Bogoriella megaspora]